MIGPNLLASRTSRLRLCGTPKSRQSMTRTSTAYFSSASTRRNFAKGPSSADILCRPGTFSTSTKSGLYRRTNLTKCARRLVRGSSSFRPRRCFENGWQGAQAENKTNGLRASLTAESIAVTGKYRTSRRSTLASGKFAANELLASGSLSIPRTMRRPALRRPADVPPQPQKKSITPTAGAPESPDRLRGRSSGTRLGLIVKSEPKSA
jgi:hypothetical protein